jgi:3-oxoacyl-[acyl-carrier protein] reductase
MGRNYVLVSGAAGGIGSAVCRMLPGKSFTPIIGYRTSRDRAEALARECGGICLGLDLSSDDSIQLALLTILRQVGDEDRLSGVVLAASPPPELLSFGKLQPDLFMHQFRVNVAGPQALLSGLIRNHFRKFKSGTVIAISSQAAGSETQPPASGMGAYVVAKSATRSLMSVCAVEHPWLTVRVVSPTFTQTPMLNVFDSRYLELLQARHPFSTAEEVAQQVLEGF